MRSKNILGGVPVVWASQLGIESSLTAFEIPLMSEKERKAIWSMVRPWALTLHDSASNDVITIFADEQTTFDVILKTSIGYVALHAHDIEPGVNVTKAKLLSKPVKCGRRYFTAIVRDVNVCNLFGELLIEKV